jgi:hypothetical protein
MKVFAVDLRLKATVYVEALDEGHAKRRLETHLGTWRDPEAVTLAASNLPVADRIEIDPVIMSYGTPRRSTVDQTGVA